MRNLFNWADTDSIPHFSTLSWWIKVGRKPQMFQVFCNPSLPPMASPTTSALQPLCSQFLFLSPAQDMLSALSSITVVTHTCRIATFRGIFNEELSENFINWLALGFQQRERHWQVTGRCCQKGQPGSWSKGAAGTERREVWSIRARWEMRLWKVWAECQQPECLAQALSLSSAKAPQNPLLFPSLAVPSSFHPSSVTQQSWQFVAGWC